MAENYKFRAADFYAKLEGQQYTCPLTGRELKPQTTTAEHIVTLESGGKHALENIFLIDRHIARLKRHLNEQEIVDLARDVIEHIGLKYGLKIEKVP